MIFELQFSSLWKRKLYLLELLRKMKSGSRFSGTKLTASTTGFFSLMNSRMRSLSVSSEFPGPMSSSSRSPRAALTFFRSSRSSSFSEMYSE